MQNFNNYYQAPYPTPSYSTSNSKNRYEYVNGIEGAKAFQLLPNSSIMLMDSDSPMVFLKTSDNTGRSSLRYFKLLEVTEEDLKQSSSVNANNTLYVPMEDFNALNKKYDDLLAKVDSLALKLDKSKRESKSEV